jgi:hypothetical protein
MQAFGRVELLFLIYGISRECAKIHRSHVLRCRSLLVLKEYSCEWKYEAGFLLSILALLNTGLWQSGTSFSRFSLSINLAVECAHVQFAWIVGVLGRRRAPALSPALGWSKLMIDRRRTTPEAFFGRGTKPPWGKNAQADLEAGAAKSRIPAKNQQNF